MILIFRINGALQSQFKIQEQTIEVAEEKKMKTARILNSIPNSQIPQMKIQK